MQLLPHSPSDFRVTMQPRFQGDNFAKNLALVNKTKDLARRKGVTPGQLALAWLHVRPSFGRSGVHDTRPAGHETDD